MGRRCTPAFQRAVLERFDEEGGRYRLFVDQEVINVYAQRIGSLIVAEGGDLVPHPSGDVKILFPKGTRIIEYDVPPPGGKLTEFRLDGRLHLASFGEEAALLSTRDER